MDQYRIETEWVRPSTGQVYTRIIGINVWFENYGEDADGRRGEWRRFWEVSYTDGDLEHLDYDTFTDDRDYASFMDLPSTEKIVEDYLGEW